MKLYRGDSIPVSIRGRKKGRTFAQYFCSTGLMAKFGDGGSPQILKGKELLDFVLCHVGYGKEEQYFADQSPMISFTEDLNCAFSFSQERTNNKNFTNCEFEEATHFVWELEVPIEILKQESKGVYKLLFEPSSSNCLEIIESQVIRGFEKETVDGDLTLIGEAVMNYMASKINDSSRFIHQALLINVIEFISSQNTSLKKEYLVSNTIERGKRDSEWLLLPQDPMPDGLGLSSRFPMNKYLKPHSYLRTTNSH